MMDFDSCIILHIPFLCVTVLMLIRHGLINTVIPYILRRKIMMNLNTQWQMMFSMAVLVGLSGCASNKTPATADVAVSREAVAAATSSGAADLAPVEMQSAREKLLRANQALAAKDYKTAQDLAVQASADAQLAQSKANSAKATSAADELQQNIRLLREELQRANATSQQ
jgi:hypothetical protein